MATAQRRNFARFFFLSLALFCLLVPLWGQISPLYTRLLATITQPFLPSLPGQKGNPPVEFFSRTKGTSIFLIDPRGVTEETLDRAPAISFDTGQAHRNVPLLLALFLATPGVWRGRYHKQLLIALGALFLWHAGYVSFVLHRLAAQVASAVTPGAGDIVHLSTDLPFEMFLRLFIPQLLPFLLWMGLVHFRPAPEEKKHVIAVAPVGRNEPCPCGSGRKYKRCCGAATAQS
jgi:hypothetical protein